VDLRPLWNLAWPFAALTTLTIASQRLGILFVSTMIGDTGAGLYSAATRLVDGMKFGHYAVLGALLPMLSGRQAGVQNDFRNGFRLIGLLSVLMAGAVTFLAQPLTYLFYGTEYQDAAPLLKYLCWSLLPYSVSAFISVDMVARGMESRLLQASIVSIVVFALLFAVLIPTASLTGAAYAALIGEVIQAAIFWRAWGLLQRETIVGGEISHGR
jgi:O-antigen/teichoic acid export membrane protein